MKTYSYALVVGLTLGSVSACPPAAQVVDSGPLVDANTAVDTRATNDASTPDQRQPDGLSVDAAQPDTRVANDAASPDTSTTPDAARADSASSDRAPGDDAASEDANLPAGEIEVWLAHAEDAVTSYLIDAGEGAYNLFWGDTVHLGRHWDVDHVSYHTALRFTAVPLPAGAIVDAATLEISPTNDVDYQNNLWLNIYAERSNNSAPFEVDNYESGRPDQRARSTAHIDHWLVRCNDDCTDLTEYDCPQRRRDCWQADTRYACPKDLKGLLQEVIDLPGWQAGNALTLLLINAATDQDGSNYQSARSVTGVDAERGTGFRPRLRIAFHLP